MPASGSFPVIHVGADEAYQHPDYRFDNSRREAPQTCVIQRTLAGAGFFRDAAGRRLVPAGQAMLFTHREPSGYGYPPEATEPYRLRFLAFSPDGGVRELFARLRADFGAVVRLPEESEAAALFDETVEGCRERRFRDRLQEAELVYRLLIALYREQVQGTRASDPVEFGHHYIRNHFRAPVNLKAIAQKCGVSREHFIREFSRRYAEPPGTMLRRLRLEHAHTMLAATGLAVQDIALASGFAGSNTFCRAYRGKFGKSPGNSRR